MLPNEILILYYRYKDEGESMKCNVCKKREATIHIQEVVNNNIKTLHLCEECARAYGLKTELMEVGFNVVDFFNNFSNGQVSVVPKVENKIPGFKKIDLTEEIFFEDEDMIYCPECGISYDQFLETGKAGCGYCYTAFKANVKSIFRRVHGKTLHIGKVPLRLEKPLKINRDIINLDNRLRLAVKNEKYSKAAKIRDKIKNLKELLNNNYENRRKN